MSGPGTSSFRSWPTSTATFSPLGERECSIQRRHQKLIEEAPSLQVTPRIREDIAKTLKRCLTAIGYQNAGTVEFLMDEDGKLYFIEMNTRIQVEHPVTEMVTGIDLVKAQLRIAAGETLTSILPEAVPIRGHAIECRVNAEHPEKFTPSAGRITAFNVPGGNGVRVDTAQYAEGIVPPYYDSLIAKLIVHGKDRAEAMARMSRALEMFVVEGIHTTIPLHRRILDDPEFREGNFDTKFMERFFEREKLRRGVSVSCPACIPFWMPACCSGPAFRLRALPASCARPVSVSCNTAIRRPGTRSCWSGPRCCAGYSRRRTAV